MAGEMTASGRVRTRTPERETVSAVRAAGVAGAAGVALAALFGTLARAGEVPWWTDSPGVVAAWFADVRLDAAQSLSAGLQPVAWLLLAVFVVKLAAVLAAADGGWRVAEVTLAVAGVLMSVFGVARLAPALAVTFRAGRGGLDPNDYVLLNDLDFALFWPSLSLGAAVLVAAAVAMLRTGLFDRPLAWSALLLAPVVVVVAVLPAADPPVLEVGVGLTWLWFVVVGLSMAAHPERYA